MEMKKNKKIITTIYLNEELYDLIYTESLKQRKSVNAVVNELLKRQLVGVELKGGVENGGQSGQAEKI